MVSGWWLASATSLCIRIIMAVSWSFTDILLLIPLYRLATSIIRWSLRSWSWWWFQYDDRRYRTGNMACLAPQLPHGMIYNIIVVVQNIATSKIFVIRGIANEWNLTYFRKRLEENGNWSNWICSFLVSHSNSLKKLWRIFVTIAFWLTIHSGLMLNAADFIKYESVEEARQIVGLLTTSQPLLILGWWQQSLADWWLCRYSAPFGYYGYWGLLTTRLWQLQRGMMLCAIQWVFLSCGSGGVFDDVVAYAVEHGYHRAENLVLFQVR